MRINKKKKADNFCIMGMVSFLSALVFITILAASTAKMNSGLQALAIILAVFFSASAIICIVYSMKLYDGERDKRGY
jgi:hypothetical protein